ncbi:hypothetical protein GCM10009696_06110 [Kocuria himachalensis]
MPHYSRHCPRADVAAPVAPANGLFQAITWALHQSEDLGGDSIGVLVASAGMGEKLHHLRRLKARGVKIGTVAQAARATIFHGAVIVYAPDARMLTEAEDIDGVMAFAVVAGDNDTVSPWVDAYHPQHLGGQRLSPRDPFAGHPQVHQAMTGLTLHLSRCPPRPGPAEFEVMTKMLHQLRTSGCQYTPEQMLAAALRLDWPGHHAWTLHEAAVQALTGPAAMSATGARTLQPST